jgi:hypothetical protein
MMKLPAGAFECIGGHEHGAWYLRRLVNGALWIRGRRSRMKVAGFEFFPDRESLVKTYGTLASRFANVSCVSAMWVIGQKFYHSDENTDRIKRLLCLIQRATLLNDK